MSGEGVDKSKRRFLTAATSVIAGAGAVAVAVPFAASWLPSAKAQAAGVAKEVDISKLEPGQKITIEWRSKPVWIVRRTQETLDNLEGLNDILRDPNSEMVEQQPTSSQNIHRSLRPEILVLVGLCTHLGCVPTYRPELAPDDLGEDWKGGFYCPCHNSRFDLAGRVFQGVPAPLNLPVPPHHYLSDTVILIGENGVAA
ncbi:MAG: ubiquinol-cytochrome c reductase iron-sulfur subunit [Gammaproteobacteria bacterium]|nr:ubiquinol-cytochrome c reductase iron-sulfur subunit [Gammaproteobacteria bacterium]